MTSFEPFQGDALEAMETLAIGLIEREYPQVDPRLFEQLGRITFERMKRDGFSTTDNEIATQ
jgi:hypothetical protein